MYDVEQMSFQALNGCLSGSRQNAAQVCAKAARELYINASLMSRLGRLWSRLTRRSNQLLDPNAYTPRNLSGDGYFAGIRSVPLSQIRGSEGRLMDFDAEFRPTQTHSQNRWLSVATARMRGVPLPPVELIQVGDIYFVRDGHHRVSVARALGELDIDAEVRVWRAAAPARQAVGGVTRRMAQAA